MQSRVTAIGIDAPSGDLLGNWLDRGLLPNIAAVARDGAAGTCVHTKYYRNERCWETFLDGSPRDGAGSVFDPGRYGYFNESLQDERPRPPFYALGEGFSVCTFDLPAPISPAVRGLQVAGWGSELNSSKPVSMPAGLIDELTAKHGGDPKFEQAVGVRGRSQERSERSFTLPSLYDPAALQRFKADLLTAVERRTAICEDLLSRREWNLFLALYSESHTANHMLWHLGEAFPVVLQDAPPGHAMLEVYQAIDRGIGRIRGCLPRDAHLLVYTIDHTSWNTMDVPSLALLPELAYRWNFPGRSALAPGDPRRPVPPLRRDYARHWKHEVWSLATEAGASELESPSVQEAQGDPLSWHPANWYRPLWPRMKAFALPSVSDGHLRVNLKGREAAGVVEADDYDRVLDDLCRVLERTTNPRTGRLLVQRLLRTRRAPSDAPEIPPDLIVCWDGGAPADAMDSPEFGRIGPVPFFRSGGHVAHGTVCENTIFACGPGIAAGSRMRSGALEDLPATILHLAGAAPPAHMSGRSLLERSRQRAGSA